jgi:Subtilase family
MSNKFEHLPFNRIEGSLPRRSNRGGGGGDKRTDRRSQGIQIISQIGEIKKIVQEQHSRFSLDPKLIFKIRLSNDRNLTDDDLGKSGLSILERQPKVNQAIVVFSSDLELTEFTNRIEQYSGLKPGSEYGYLDAIESICPLESEDRIGRLLELQPLELEEVAPLDLELWHTGDRTEMSKYLSDIGEVLTSISKDRSTFKMTDKYIGNYLCLARIKIDREVLDLLLDEFIVKEINRRPHPAFESRSEYNPSLSSLPDSISPNSSSCGIVVIDSGIQPGHPLLSSTIGEAEVFLSNSQKATGGEIDTSGHGTGVSGIAAYGDIEKCILSKEFRSSATIFSARILDDKNEYDEDLLLENQLEEVVQYFTDNYPTKCHVFNLSIGNRNSIYNSGDKQFRLAAKLDEIAYRYQDYDLVFVVSAGNTRLFSSGEGERYITDYPKYILDSESRIIDPATSAIAITVGSLSLGRGSMNNPDDAQVNSVAKIRGYPSPFTRTGFGVDGMIKPDVVAYGGDFVVEGNRIMGDSNAAVSVVTLNLFSPGKSLFTIVKGTSFAAPYISNLAAQLFDKYPKASSNLIRALIANSASLPPEIPNEFQIGSKMPDRDKTAQMAKQLSVYGYGQPNLERAMYSMENDVVLVCDRVDMEIGNFHVYEIPILPPEFLKTKGERTLSITMAFDPPTRHTRGDSYLGVTMGFSLFKGVDVADIVNSFVDAKKAKENRLDDDFQELSIDSLKKKCGSTCQVELKPGSSIRKKGTLQRGQIVISDQATKFDRPLYLVVSSNRKWARQEDIKLQRYSLVVSLTHTNEEVKVYHQIQAKIQERSRQQLRIR